MTVGGAASGVYTGAIKDSITLVKTGSGAQYLNGTNSYAGGTTINAGVLQFTGTAGVPTTPATGAIAINGGALSTNGNTAAQWLASGKIAANPTGTRPWPPTMPRR